MQGAQLAREDEILDRQVSELGAELAGRVRDREQDAATVKLHGVDRLLVHLFPVADAEVVCEQLLEVGESVDRRLACWVGQRDVPIGPSNVLDEDGLLVINIRVDYTAADVNLVAGNDLARPGFLDGDVKFAGFAGVKIRDL